MPMSLAQMILNTDRISLLELSTHHILQSYRFKKNVRSLEPVDILLKILFFHVCMSFVHLHRVIIFIALFTKL